MTEQQNPNVVVVKESSNKGCLIAGCAGVVAALLALVILVGGCTVGTGLVVYDAINEVCIENGGTLVEGECVYE